MTHPPDDAVLSKLSDSGQTVSSSEQDIRGLKVKDKGGNDLGKVDDLLIDDQARKVRFLLVEHGGFLGMGQTKSFIPVDAITKISDREVHINHSKEHVANAPGYDPKLVKDQTYLGGISGYYGYTPYWGMGYGYPEFPVY